MKPAIWYLILQKQVPMSIFIISCWMNRWSTFVMSWFMIFVPNIPTSFLNFRIKRSLLIRDVVTFPGGLASGRPPLWHRAQWRCGGPERRDLLRWHGQAKDFRGVGEAWQDHQVENITQKTEKTWDTMIICMGKTCYIYNTYIYITHIYIIYIYMISSSPTCQLRGSRFWERHPVPSCLPLPSPSFSLLPHPRPPPCQLPRQQIIASSPALLG